MLAIAAAQMCVYAVPQLTLSVFNGAEVPDAILQRSIHAASDTFRAAGISSRWVVCDPEGCHGELPEGGVYLQLFILPRQKTEFTGGKPGTIAGMAIKGEFAHPRGYAFYDVVQAVSASTRRPAELVLAGVLAHEAGHMLGLPHQAHGIMRAALDATDIDSMQTGRAFCPLEQAGLREALRTRTALAMK